MLTDNYQNVIPKCSLPFQTRKTGLDWHVFTIAQFVKTKILKAKIVHNLNYKLLETHNALGSI